MCVTSQHMKMTMTLSKEGEFYHQCQHSVQHGATSLDVLAAATTYTCTRSRLPASAELNGHYLGDEVLGTIGYGGKLGSHSPTVSVIPHASTNSCLPPWPPLVPSSSCSLSQHQLFPAVNGVTYIPEPNPSEMAVQKMATHALSATTVYHPYPSPPYSVNSSFKNLFSSDTTVQLGHPSFLSFPSNAVSEAPQKPYPPLELQSSVMTSMVSQPAQQAVFAPFVPKPEPSSPYACMHSPTASYWSNPLRHDGSISWSAPPVPISMAQNSHTDFTFPTGSNGFRPLSPISPLSPLSASTNGQPLVFTEPPPLTSVPLDASQLRSAPGPTFSVPPGNLEHLPMQRRSRCRRFACTCLNCINGVNSKANHLDEKKLKLNGNSKKKQHICHYPGCGKGYGKTSYLRAHQKRHTGERPFICNWLFGKDLFCGKRFFRRDDLRRHLRIHTGEKRFICPECAKRFMRSDHLNKHIKTHQNKF